MLTSLGLDHMQTFVAVFSCTILVYCFKFVRKNILYLWRSKLRFFETRWRQAFVFLTAHFQKFMFLPFVYFMGPVVCDLLLF